MDARENDGRKTVLSKRVLVGEHGHYSLRNWHDARGKPRLFACTVVKVSSELIELAGPITGTVGEWVSAFFEHLGTFEGPITHTSKGQFTMWIVATIDSRQKIASKIAWASDTNRANNRRHERFVPRHPHSVLHFAEHRTIPCEIIDYSLSGVAVCAEIRPKPGSIIKVGEIVTRVLRPTAEGFQRRVLTHSEHHNGYGTIPKGIEDIRNRQP